jgi:CRISPR-associated protein Csc1
MPYIYRCTLTLLEATFFSSREVSSFYQTEPFIGNYALAYALKLCQSPYFNDGTIHYKADLGALNERGIYITPAAVVDEPRFVVGWFNAQPDTYWYAMGSNVLATKPDGSWAELRNKVWYIVRNEGEKGRKIRLENRPQVGRIRMLSIGNHAVCYVVSERELQLPSYIRLGKFMSKARVEVQRLQIEQAEEIIATCALLNAADLPTNVRPLAYDLLNVPPAQLLRNVRVAGPVYRLPRGEWLPVGMRFGVEHLP